MTTEPVPARLVRGRILCGAMDHAGHYWCRGLIALARRGPDGWEAYQDHDGYWRRRTGYVPETAIFAGQAWPLPFTKRCPNPSCGAVAVVDDAVLALPGK